MRVSPYCQYQLVDKKIDSFVRLACLDNGVSCRCASFVCCGRASAGPDGLSPLKVGPIQQHDVCQEDLVSHKNADNSSDDDGDSKSGRKVYIESCMKRTFDFKGAVSEVENLEETLVEMGEDEVPGRPEGKRVQWTDACGKDLFEIREFEPSEPDEELEGNPAPSCSCTIM